MPRTIITRLIHGDQTTIYLPDILACFLGRGFSVSSLQYFRSFYIACPQLLCSGQNQHAQPLTDEEGADEETDKKIDTSPSQAIQHAVRVESTAGQISVGQVSVEVPAGHPSSTVRRLSD